MIKIFVYSADVSAEELFNMFFGGSFGGQNVYVRRGRQWERQRTEANSQVVPQSIIQSCLIITTKLIYIFFALLSKGICWNGTTAAAATHFNTRLFICHEQLPCF